MPYTSDKEVPKYVPAGKREQWREAWNRVWQETGSEKRAFAGANSVAGPGAKEVKRPRGRRHAGRAGARKKYEKGSRGK